MFPLVHHFVNRQIFLNVPNSMILGSLFPDIAEKSGMNREEAHVMGLPFYAWCKKHMPQGIPLAKGIISHGISPHCLDYYSDEYWPNYQKGWCFLQGEKYMNQVAEATHMPSHLIWWKAHNFVEMSYELITNNDYPDLKYEILTAVNNKENIKEASNLLACYTGLKKEKIIESFIKTPDIFAISEINAERLAEKQNNAFIKRYQINNADVTAMAALINQMYRELKSSYYPFLKNVLAKMSKLIGLY